MELRAVSNTTHAPASELSASQAAIEMSASVSVHVTFPTSSMNVTFACRGCGNGVRRDVVPGQPLVCTHCGQQTMPPAQATDGRRLTRCLVCPSTDLFVRKDFPQRLGVALVAVGVVGSSIAWAYSQIYLTYAILFATAIIDVILYWLVPNALMCYRCHAEYRQVDGLETHAAFDLETHERDRQQAARLGQQSGA